MIIFTIMFSLALLSGCVREETERQTMPYIETVPPRSVTSPTFTGSTAEYYTAESTRSPMTGAISEFGSVIGDISAETADSREYHENISAETAIEYDRPATAAADTAIKAEVFSTDTADTAEREVHYEIIVPETAMETAVVSAETADTYR